MNSWSNSVTNGLQLELYSNLLTAGTRAARCRPKPTSNAQMDKGSGQVAFFRRVCLIPLGKPEFCKSCSIPVANQYHCPMGVGRLQISLESQAAQQCFSFGILTAVPRSSWPQSLVSSLGSSRLVPTRIRHLPFAQEASGVEPPSARFLTLQSFMYIKPSRLY